MNLRRLSPAEDEYVQAAAFYLEESPQAAARFADEVEEAIEDILRNPLRNVIYEENLRVKFLHDFPFSIYYIAEETEIVIVAISHQSRRPKYWKRRL